MAAGPRSCSPVRAPGAPPCTMTRMERWLNTRVAVLTAWSIVALIALGGAGFALFLVLPLLRGEDGGSGADAGLPADTVAAVASSTPASGRATFSGTLARVEGQALVLNLSDNETARVLVRRSAPVGTLVTTSVGEIRAGEPVAVTVSRQADGRLLALRVRLQPPEVPVTTGSGDQRAGGATEPSVVTGSVTGVDGNRVRVRSARGEQTYEISSGARITRFRPMQFDELRPGQRVIIDGERLVDGSLAALSVQVFESR